MSSRKLEVVYGFTAVRLFGEHQRIKSTRLLSNICCVDDSSYSKVVHDLTGNNFGDWELLNVEGPCRVRCKLLRRDSSLFIDETPSSFESNSFDVKTSEEAVFNECDLLTLPGDNVEMKFRADRVSSE